MKEEAAEETDEECALDLLRCRHSSDSWSQCEDSGGAGGQQVSAQEGAGCLKSLPSSEFNLSSSDSQWQIRG